MLRGGRGLVNDILGARAADCDDSQAGARIFRLSSTSSASSHGVRKCTPGSVAFADLHRSDTSRGRTLTCTAPGNLATPRSASRAWGRGWGKGSSTVVENSRREALRARDITCQSYVDPSIPNDKMICCHERNFHIQVFHVRSAAKRSCHNFQRIFNIQD